jgi:hypothetical protein
MKTLRIVSILAVIVTVLALVAACAPPAPTPEPAKQDAPTAAPPPTTAPDTVTGTYQGAEEPPTEAPGSGTFIELFPTTRPPSGPQAARLRPLAGWPKSGSTRCRQQRLEARHPARRSASRSAIQAWRLACGYPPAPLQGRPTRCDLRSGSYEAEAPINCAQVMKDQG